jgi:hypothetical protein
MITCSSWPGYVLAEQAGEHLFELGHQGVEVDRPRLQHLLATEGEELAGEARGAVGRLADLGGVLAARVARGEVFEQQVGVARDGGEDVVEIVRDPARQPAHGFHLLRLPELLLELHPLGDVAPDAEDFDGPAVLELGGDGELGHPVLARGCPHPELARGPRLAAQHPPQELEG